MDEPRAVPASISVADAEKFWSEGSDAYYRSGQTQQPENQADGFAGTCSAHGYAHCVWCSEGPGIDMPGVGRVPAAILPGSPYVPGAVPDPLRNLLNKDERNSLLGKLLFAAWRLADSRIHAVWPSKRDQCLECGKLGTAEGMIDHRRLCRAGDVFEVLNKLQSVDPAEDRKEVAGNPPEHRQPAGAPPLAGIPVSVIVPVAVLREARRLMGLWRESIVDSHSGRDEDGVGAIPLTYPDAIRDVMDLDSAIAGISKVIGGAA